jgi:hypothetical protein
VQSRSPVAKGKTREQTATALRLPIGSLCQSLLPKIPYPGWSGPNSPASIVSIEEDTDDYTGDGLKLEGPPFGLEKIYDYESGGHRPIYLDDCLGKDDR